jgi:hypothetical protein
MQKEIVFTNITEINSVYEPIPANLMMPEWYQTTPSYVDNGLKIKKDLKTNFSIKKCMPVFDILSSGYIVLTEADIYVSKKKLEDGNIVTWYEWASGGSFIDFHDNVQSVLHPLTNNQPIPKLNLNWFIKTPKMYSCLLLPPVHRKNIISILPGIIDSDLFKMPLTLPFILNDENFEGVIPAGTPIVQIFPFKRERWKMAFGKKKEILEYLKNKTLFETLFINKYKRLFWNKKDYK